MIERGARRPNLEELVGLAQALDVGLETLVFGDSRPGEPSLQAAQEQVVATPEELTIVERMLQMLLMGYRIARREAAGEGRESC
jgi:transcriptional regulator with XRE-family HTH domain